MVLVCVHIDCIMIGLEIGVANSNVGSFVSPKFIIHYPQCSPMFPNYFNFPQNFHCFPQFFSFPSIFLYSFNFPQFSFKFPHFSSHFFIFPQFSSFFLQFSSIFLIVPQFSSFFPQFSSVFLNFFQFFQNFRIFWWFSRFWWFWLLEVNFLGGWSMAKSVGKTRLSTAYPLLNPKQWISP